MYNVSYSGFSGSKPVSTPKAPPPTTGSKVGATGTGIPIGPVPEGASSATSSVAETYQTAAPLYQETASVDQGGGGLTPEQQLALMMAMQPQPTVKKKSWIPWVIGGVALAAVGGGTAYYFLVYKKKAAAIGEEPVFMTEEPLVARREDQEELYRLAKKSGLGRTRFGGFGRAGWTERDKLIREAREMLHVIWEASDGDPDVMAEAKEYAKGVATVAKSGDLEIAREMVEEMYSMA